MKTPMRSWYMACIIRIGIHIKPYHMRLILFDVFGSINFAAVGVIFFFVMDDAIILPWLSLQLLFHCIWKFSFCFLSEIMPQSLFVKGWVSEILNFFENRKFLAVSKPKLNVNKSYWNNNTIHSSLPLIKTFDLLS